VGNLDRGETGEERRGVGGRRDEWVNLTGDKQGRGEAMGAEGANREP